mmetsp:Transcript_901/g.1233  ORF Transcript_901/g.1233 Transcript_901/m.1233 type:complete len:109 (-) Transcript_901:34-360(-)
MKEFNFDTTSTSSISIDIDIDISILIDIDIHILLIDVDIDIEPTSKLRSTPKGSLKPNASLGCLASVFTVNLFLSIEAEAAPPTLASRNNDAAEKENMLDFIVLMARC